MNPLPSHDYLCSLFHYCPLTGTLTWRRDNKKAGWTNGKGYRCVRVSHSRTIYRVHRIIWKMMYKQDPKQEIDHINRSRDDNRLVNLRLATRSEQTLNSHPRGTSPYKHQ